MTHPGGFHLAQINVARMRHPLGDARMQGFVDALDRINALADAAPGFVWRLQDDSGNATDIRPFDDLMMIANMSVWHSVDTLFDFVYRTAHVDVMRGRTAWFETPTEAFQALWWLPAGILPTVADGIERLDHLRHHGSTAAAFTIKQRFPPPAAAA